MPKVERITLGSGDLFVTEFTGEVPDIETICVDNNQIGYIKGGATLEYKPTFYRTSDDKGRVSKTIITEEEATLKSGIMTFNATTLQKLSATGRVTEDPTKKTRTLKIGGIANMNNKSYVIVFKHEDKIDGNIYVLIVGSNEAGFSLAFAKDKETVIDAEFKALPHDSEGTLIEYIEEDKSITQASQASYSAPVPKSK